MTRVGRRAPPDGLRGWTLGTAIVAAAVGTASGVEGQTPRVLQPGTRIKLSSPAVVHWELEGMLMARQGSVLRVQPRGSDVVVSVPAASVTRLRVLTEDGRATWRGAALGLAAGLAAGALVIGIDEADGEIDPDCGELHCYGGGFRALLLGAGLGAGVLVGRTIRVRRWRDVPLPDVSVGPTRGPPGTVELQVQVRF